MRYQPKVQTLCHGRRHLGQSLRARASWQARDSLSALQRLVVWFLRVVVGQGLLFVARSEDESL